MLFVLSFRAERTCCASVNRHQNYACHWEVNAHFLPIPKAGPVAQWLEQGTHNPLVVGSNPSGPTTFKGEE